MNILKLLTKNRITGNAGEDAAAKFLKRKKYKILERNYVAVGCEIDIIAENKEFIAFVEVKTRTLGKESESESRPAAAVTPEKQRKIIAAAKFYTHNDPSEKNLRLDVIEVYLNENQKVDKILHFENAFNINSARKAHRK